ncbi:unnamed protein product, partial [Discosporangium mesarthrocarpum]
GGGDRGSDGVKNGASRPGGGKGAEGADGNGPEEENAVELDSMPEFHPLGDDRLVPQVLMRYPPDSVLPCGNVADYCFPEGVAVSP